MREVWPLPSDELLKPTGQEWLLQSLAVTTEEQRAMILMTLWRIWHAHNEMTHEKLYPPIEGSRHFLVSYLDSLLMIKQAPSADLAKGKVVINRARGFKREPTCADGRQSVASTGRDRKSVV